MSVFVFCVFSEERWILRDGNSLSGCVFVDLCVCIVCVIGGKVDTERRKEFVWLFLCFNFCDFV